MTDLPQNTEPKKRTRKPKQDGYKFDLVIVVWDDAGNLDHVWYDLTEDKEELIAQTVTTVGFLVKDTEKHILLCADYDELNNINTRMQIPKGMIKEVRVLVRKKEIGNTKVQNKLRREHIPAKVCTGS